MTRYISAILFSFFPFLHSAQENLVPNGSFEECSPNTGNESGYFGANAWYNANVGTVDFFTTATPDPNCYLTDVNVSLGEDPQGLSAVDGNQFVGMYSYHPNFCLREMLQCKLSAPLEAGVKYCIGFYTRSSFQMNTAVDGIGLQLSSDSIVDYSSSCLLPIPIALQNPLGNPITEAQNWTYVSGDYLATGSERFLTLCNVLSDENLTFSAVDGTTVSEAAYYFFDEISVVNCDIANSIEEQTFQFSLYPNPTHDFISLQTYQDFEEVHILQVDGKQVASFNDSQKRNFSVRELAPGMYFLKVITSQGKVGIQRFQRI